MHCETFKCVNKKKRTYGNFFVCDEQNERWRGHFNTGLVNVWKITGEIEFSSSCSTTRKVAIEHQQQSIQPPQVEIKRKKGEKISYSIAISHAVRRKTSYLFRKKFT